MAARNVNARLGSGRGHELIPTVGILLVILLLFAMTQLRSIHWRAALFILLTIHLLLTVLLWQLAFSLPAPVAHGFRNVLLSVYGFALLTTAAIVATNLYARGTVVPRSLPSVSFFMALCGLLWGCCVGYASCAPLPSGSADDGANAIAARQPGMRPGHCCWNAARTWTTYPVLPTICGRLGCASRANH